MNKKLVYLIFTIIFLGFNNDLKARGYDSVSKENLYRILLSDTTTHSCFVSFLYINKFGKIEHFICPNFYLYSIVKENTGMSYELYKKSMFKLLINNTPLNYTKYGKISAREVKKEKILQSYVNLGADKFLGLSIVVNLRNYLQADNFPEIIAAGFKLGLLFHWEEESMRFFHICNCKLKK